MTGSVTRIPDVLAELLDVISTAAPDLQVADGPTIGEVGAEAICVGFPESPEQPGYSTEYIRQEGLGRTRYQEAWSVRCFLTVSSGVPDMAALRSRAAAILGAIAAELTARTRDVDAWDRAAFSGNAEWVPVIDAQGGLCNVFFTVEGASLL